MTQANGLSAGIYLRPPEFANGINICVPTS